MDNDTWISFNRTNEPVASASKDFGLQRNQSSLPLEYFVNCIAVLMLNQCSKEDSFSTFLLDSPAACNDLFSCSSFLASIIINAGTCDRFGHSVGCYILGWVSSASYSWSLFIIMVMSVERYMSIQHTFFHHKHCSLKRLIFVCFAGLTFDLIPMMLPLCGVGLKYRYYDDNRYCTLNFVNFANTGKKAREHKGLIIVLCVNCLIKSLVVAYCNIVVSISIRRRSQGPLKYQNSARTRMQDQALALSRLTQVITYANVLLTDPFFIRVLVHVVQSRFTPYTVDTRITAFLLFLSPLVNPFLYVASNKDCRKFLIDKVLCRNVNCRILPTPTPTNSTRDTDLSKTPDAEETSKRCLDEAL